MSTPSEQQDSFLSHLEALRGTLLSILAATALLYPVSYALSAPVIDFLVATCCPPELGTLHYFSPLEVFVLRLRLSVVLSLALGFPWNTRALWKFLLPALYPSERKSLSAGILASSFLFVAGIAFAVLVILPFVMRFAVSFASQELRPVLGLASFIHLAGGLALAFGLMFQTPLAVTLAARLGLVSPSTLRRSRPYVYTVILILAAVLTPPDVFSQLCLAVPTALLFELGLLLAKGKS